MKGTIENATQWYYAGISPEPVTTDDDDVDPLFWWLDTDTGDIYNLEPSIDDAPSDWVNKGPLAPAQVPPGYTGDNADPDPVEGFSVSSQYQQQTDGTSLPVLGAVWGIEDAEADIIGYELQWDAGSYPDVGSGEQVYQTADWLNPLTLRVGRDVTQAILTPVLGGATYDVRIRAYDNEGRVGDWVTILEVPIAPDDDAPPIPQPNAVGGYRMVGVYWNPVSAADLSHYEVRLRAVGVATWPDPVETRSTSIVFGNLDVFPGTPEGPGGVPPAVPSGTLYEVQVRSVDHSGNVLVPGVPEDPGPPIVPAIPPRALKPDDPGYEDTGWSPIVTPLPKATLVGQADIAFDTVVANFMRTGVLSADLVMGGSMRVGGPPLASTPLTEGLRVYDEHNHPIGAWGDFGWIVADPHITPHSRAIWAGDLDGTLGIRYTADYQWLGTDPIEQGIPLTVWTTAVGPDGINAEAIKFGAAGGGSNRILNAGVELQAYPTVAPVGVEWTDAAQWDDVLAGSINLNVGTADLKMTAT